MKKGNIKKVILIAMALAVLLVLTGCDDSPHEEKVDEAVPSIGTNLTRYKIDEKWEYIVDNNTGVVYLYFTYEVPYQGYGGITVMLNADGTPVTCDQLNLQ